jgi:hypothetical protein
MSDLTRARANIRRAAREQSNPKRVRFNRADYDILMADYLRMAISEAAAERQTPIDNMINAAVVLTIMPLLVAAGWFLRS